MTCIKCGLAPKAQGSHSYCRGCANAIARATRPAYRDLSPAEKKKANARAYANAYQRRGKLIPQPCERCSGESTHKHHDDYDKPLQVRWFCGPCHRQLHDEEANPAYYAALARRALSSHSLAATTG